MRRLRLAVLIAILLLPTSAHAIWFIELYQGLPNYDEQPAFVVNDAKIHNDLRSALRHASTVSDQCKIGKVSIEQDWSIDLWTNVCDPKTFEHLRNIVGTLAPNLRKDRITLWIYNLDNGKEKDLLVGYIDVSTDKDAPYPYLSLWRLRGKKGIYKAIYAGPFLNGKLHAVRHFGTNPQEKIVFVKHVSCIACEPIVYLTAIDFDAGDDAKPFEFTYSEDHQDFAPTIEYGLPGMGHTVDATVETRLLPPSDKGPHVLQFFDMEEGQGPDEWWAFTCKEYRCDYKEYKNEAPSAFKKLWKEAKKL